MKVKTTASVSKCTARRNSTGRIKRGAPIIASLTAGANQAAISESSYAVQRPGKNGGGMVTYSAPIAVGAADYALLTMS